MPPGPMESAIANGCSMLFLGGIVLQMVGHVVLPEPIKTKFTENRGVFVVGIFMANMVGAQMLQTGAFEVFLDEQQIWSKIDTKRLPSFVEITEQLETVAFKLPAAAPNLSVGDEPEEF